MKILAVNGSGRSMGNTAALLEACGKVMRRMWSSRRLIWLSTAEVSGLKYAMVIGVCEQAGERDMGFTVDAMSMPLKALDYRVTYEVKVLNLFKAGEAEESDEAIDR